MSILKRGSSASCNRVVYQTQTLRHRGLGAEALYDRYERVPGASQKALSEARVVLVGAGGLGGEVGAGLARKGIGQLTMYDHDAVDFSNLPRQQFTLHDVGQNKAMALAANLRLQATGHTFLRGVACSFQAAVESGIDEPADVLIVGVDNNPTRVAAAQYSLARHIPAVFLAVDPTASKGYVFVQTTRPGDPCFLCLYPDAVEDSRVYGCAGASIEILKVVAGIALYAIDSLLMLRPRPWNLKTVFLGQGGDGARKVAMRTGCRLCGGGAARRGR